MISEVTTGSSSAETWTNGFRPWCRTAISLVNKPTNSNPTRFHFFCFSASFGRSAPWIAAYRGPAGAISAIITSARGSRGSPLSLRSKHLVHLDQTPYPTSTTPTTPSKTSPQRKHSQDVHASSSVRNKPVTLELKPLPFLTVSVLRNHLIPCPSESRSMQCARYFPGIDFSLMHEWWLYVDEGGSIAAGTSSLPPPCHIVF